MEGADRPLRIALQIVEEWRLVALLDAFHDGKVQLQQVLHRIEDPPGAGRGRIGRKLLHFAVCGDINIEIRANTLQDAGKLQRGGVRRQLADRIVKDAA